MSEQTGKKSWFAKIKEGLHRTSDKLTTGLAHIFIRRKLDEQALEELEELLLSADLGIKTSQNLVQILKKESFQKDISAQEVRLFLADIIEKRLKPYQGVWSFKGPSFPHVMLMVGVNGSGKTTTLGKLAYHFKKEGKKVCLAGGDTFRAAAVDQLKLWAQRVDVSFFASDQHRDPAGLAYAAYEFAKQQGVDILMVDTAGRLHTNTDLMAELSKIKRVLQKLDPQAPHSVLLVVDGTLGQNIHQQVKIFKQAIPLTGMIITKLDGTAKGGAIISVVEETGIPLMAIGLGEKVEDLKPFEAASFAKGLMALNEQDES